MPDEAEIESLTKLLRTIGANLDDTEKGHPVMDVYFTRINSDGVLFLFKTAS
jgi:translation initiation factor 4G